MHVEIANPLWRGKRSRHSPRMRNPQFFVSGKRPMGTQIPSQWSPWMPPPPMQPIGYCRDVTRLSWCLKLSPYRRFVRQLAQTIACSDNRYFRQSSSNNIKGPVMRKSFSFHDIIMFSIHLSLVVVFCKKPAWLHNSYNNIDLCRPYQINPFKSAPMAILPDT